MSRKGFRSEKEDVRLLNSVETLKPRYKGIQAIYFKLFEYLNGY